MEDPIASLVEATSAMPENLTIPGFSSVILNNDGEDALRGQYGSSLEPYIDKIYPPVAPELSSTGLTHYERVLIIGRDRSTWYTAIVRSSKVEYPRCICTYCLTGWSCALCSGCANLPNGLHQEIYRELSTQAERERLHTWELIYRYYRRKPLTAMVWLMISIGLLSYAMG